MKAPWEVDGRKIPGPVMSYIRKIAVRAVEEKGYSPEDVVDMLGFSRSCIYDWLEKHRRAGAPGLETGTAPGAAPHITLQMDEWLKRTVLETTPETHGYDTRLWTRNILAELLYQQFGTRASPGTIGRHLRAMGLSCQKPQYRATARDPAEVQSFVEEKFPRIERLADRIDAEIAFEDESGIGMMTRHGHTWGRRGETPEVVATDRRGGYNALSTVSPAGKMRYSVTEDHINSQRFIEFLEQLLRGRTRPLILVVDRASFHTSKAVRDFVRAHRKQLRIFFLPRHAPELNPDEQVWEEIKVNRLGKQPIRNKADLKSRLYSALASLQHTTRRVISFFQLPGTQYASS